MTFTSGMKLSVSGDYPGLLDSNPERARRIAWVSVADIGEALARGEAYVFGVLCEYVP